MAGGKERGKETTKKTSEKEVAKEAKSEQKAGPCQTLACNLSCKPRTIFCPFSAPPLRGGRFSSNLYIIFFYFKLQFISFYVLQIK